MRRYMRTARATAPATGRGAVNRVVRVVLMIEAYMSAGGWTPPASNRPQLSACLTNQSGRVTTTIHEIAGKREKADDRG